MMEYEKLLNWWKYLDKGELTQEVQDQVEKFLTFLKVLMEENCIQILTYSGARDYIYISLNAGIGKLCIEIIGNQLKVKKVIRTETNISELAGILLRFGAESPQPLH